MSSTVKRVDSYGAHSYGAHPAGDQNLKPLTIALATIVGVWLIVYLLGSATKGLEEDSNLITDDTRIVMSMVGP